jgi:hypothetical protein
MITSGFGKEFVIGHTLSETGPAGERGIRGVRKILARDWTSAIVPAAWPIKAYETMTIPFRVDLKGQVAVITGGAASCAV